MFETETVGPFLIRKFKLGGGGGGDMTPLAPNGYATDLYLAKVRSSEMVVSGIQW